MFSQRTQHPLVQKLVRYITAQFAAKHRTRYLSFHLLAAWGKDSVKLASRCALHLLAAAWCDRLYQLGTHTTFSNHRVHHTSDFKISQVSQLHLMHSTRSAALAHTSNPVCKTPPITTKAGLRQGLGVNFAHLGVKRASC